MGQPGSFQPRGEDWIVRKIQELERRQNEQAAANVFGRTGITPKDGGTDLDGFVNINGEGVINGPLEVNGTMDVAGDAEFTGNMKIGGTLDLPAGIIGNEALTDPLIVSTSGVSQNNFSLGPSSTVYAGGTVTIPAGYSKASVLCMVVGGGMNSTAGLDYVYVAASINGVAGGETPQSTDAGRYATASANGIRSLTGLNGGTITLGCQMRTNGGTWTASTSTFANMNAVIYFTR
jgi:hypothetical protein